MLDPKKRNNMKHTQAILIKYLGATNTKGSRIKLTDKRFNTSIIVNMDYESQNILTQAKDFLETKGYTIITNSTFGDSEYILTVIHGDNGFKRLEK